MGCILQAILHSLTSAGGWLASGGGDETLHLFDAQARLTLLRLGPLLSTHAV